MLEHAPEVRQVRQVRWRERAWAGLQPWEKVERLWQACGAEPGGPPSGRGRAQDRCPWLGTLVRSMG